MSEEKKAEGTAVEPKAKNYYTPITIISVIMIGIMFQTNNSSFTTIMSTIAQDLIPQGKFAAADMGWIISIPAFLMIFGVLINGVLTRKISMRNTMIIGWIVYGISGGCLFFAPSEPSILLCRALMGLGIGIAQPSTKALPARIYGGNNRAKVLGWINMGGAALNICIAIGFGSLSQAIGWRYAMFFYPIWSIITICFGLLFVPSLPPENKGPNKVAKEDMRPYGTATILILIYGLLFYIFSAVIQINTSVMVKDLGLGDSGMSGIVVAFNCVGTFIGGLIFGKVYGKLGRNTLLLALAAILIGYFGFTFSKNIAMLSFFGALTCFGTVGMAIPFMVTSISFTAPAERRSTALLLFTFTTYVGQILTTPWVNLVAAITGDSSAFTALLWTGWAYVVMAVIAVIYLVVTRNKAMTAEAKYGKE